MSEEYKKLFDQNSESYLATFLEELPQITWVMDASGLALYYNKAWYAYTGLERGDIATGRARYYTHPDDLTKVMENLKTAMKNGETYEMPLRLRRHDGVYRWHLARSI